MKKILIPEKLWVGSDPKRRNSSLTAWGTDSVSKKRMATVTSEHGGDEKNCRVIPNDPLVGFRLMQSGWKDTWWLQDPRGFEFMLNNAQLNLLFDKCVIQDGVILDACVYARVGSNNALLSTRSDTYTHAVWATRMSQTKETWRKAKPGMTVVLRNGMRGQYMGKYHIMQTAHQTPTRNQASLLGENRLQLLENPLHVIWESTPHATRSHKMHLMLNPPLALIEDHTVLDAAQAEFQVNQYIQQHADQIRHSYWHTTVMAVTEKLSRQSCSLVLNTRSSGTQVQQDLALIQQGSAPMVYGRLHNGQLVKLSVFKSFLKAHPIHEASLAQCEIRHILKRNVPGGYLVHDQYQVSPSDISEVLELNLVYETALGNKLMVPV